MGKNFCSVENKWCKFLKRGICGKTQTTLDIIEKCPRIEAIETRTFFDLLQECDFDQVFIKLCHWFPDQGKNKEGYHDVFEKLKTMSPRHHRLDDLFINIRVIEEDGHKWMSIDGVNVLPGSKPINYGIEFCEWTTWISMFITQETLDKLSKEEIVAGCLYEMTFFGFTEEKVLKSEEDLRESVEEAKKKNK